jgi:hypothetical protein
MSDVKPLALEGGGAGRRAALSGPSGAEDALMLFRELSNEVRSDGGFGEVVTVESADSEAGKLDVWVDTLSVSLRPCAGATGGLSVRGSSIVPDSVI